MLQAKLTSTRDRVLVKEFYHLLAYIKKVDANYSFNEIDLDPNPIISSADLICGLDHGETKDIISGGVCWKDSNNSPVSLDFKLEKIPGNILVNASISNGSLQPQDCAILAREVFLSCFDLIHDKFVKRSLDLGGGSGGGGPYLVPYDRTTQKIWDDTKLIAAIGTRFTQSFADKCKIMRVTFK